MQARLEKILTTIYAKTYPEMPVPEGENYLHEGLPEGYSAIFKGGKRIGRSRE